MFVGRNKDLLADYYYVNEMRFVTKDLLPVPTDLFTSLKLAESGISKLFSSSELSIDGFYGAKIVKRSVLFDPLKF